MNSISLREYDYSVSDDKEYRLHCMTRCLDENSISEFIKHCLYVGQFQETILDDLMCMDINSDFLNKTTLIKLMELKRKHGSFEEKKENKKKFQQLQFENELLNKKINDLQWKSDKVDFMEQNINFLRKKIIYLQKNIKRVNDIIYDDDDDDYINVNKKQKNNF